MIDASEELSAPLWLRTMDRLLPVTTQFVLSGNIDDMWLLPGNDGHERQVVPTIDAIWSTFEAAGYEFLCTWDPASRQLRVVPGGSDDAATEALSVAGLPSEVTRQKLGEITGRLLTGSPRRGALVIELASRLLTDPARPDADEARLFMQCQLAARSARPAPFTDHTRQFQRSALLNPVIWLVHREADLPPWFLSDTMGIRSLALERPDLDTRTLVARHVGQEMEAWQDAGQSERALFISGLADSSDGFTTADLYMRIHPLMVDRKLNLRDVADAVAVHRAGVIDNPWKRGILHDRIRDGQERIRSRVIGQERAVVKTLDVLKRSATGLTGAHRRGSGRPRGVLFFAGPTGVGKTELAKAAAELIYGTEEATIRFDMSEFASEHTEARLIGSPPGYIGHEAGGELTTAARNRPFSLLLFDEIDKAHPRILDKFLQVLDDGRLTDSQGRTVDFRETFIIFTSNLGVYEDGPDGRRRLTVDPDSMSRQEVEGRIRTAVEDEFTRRLERPELLNRIGRDNIVVFDFIDRETGVQILDGMLDTVATTVEAERGVAVHFDDVRERLGELCLEDLSFGGRGIGNELEERLVNPLARTLFDEDRTSGEVHVVGLSTDDNGVDTAEIR